MASKQAGQIAHYSIEKRLNLPWKIKTARQTISPGCTWNELAPAAQATGQIF
jgi:hypothetical protein